MMICFDLDGTLLDSIYDMAYSMNQVLKRHNLMENSIEDYLSFIGNGAKILALKSVRNKTEFFDIVYKEYIIEYKKNQTNLTKPFVSIETLKNLKEKEKLSIISNKPNEDVKKIVEYYFPNIFSYYIGNIEGIKHKPDIEPFLKMKNDLNLNEKIIYVGDSYVDYEFAKNCNMEFIGVSYGYGKFDNLDIKIIDDIKELL